MKKLNSRGQIVVEYVLLLTVGIVIAVALTRSMASREADSPGFLVTTWIKLSEVIGSDIPDEGPKQPQ
jgi:uncharacterized protein (UPF0333 family)